MKNKQRILSLIIVLALLAACAPVPTPAPTAMPTATFTPQPTVTPTHTPEPQPTHTAKVEIPLEQQPATIAAATEFANAMTAAGTPITPERILQQGLIVTEKLGLDGLNYEVATTQDGWPLMIKSEGGEWKTRPMVAELFALQGVDFGYTYNMNPNPYRKIVRPPDALVGESSKIVTPEDSFYQDFIYNNLGIPNWKKVNEYLAFLDKYNLRSGAPHIYWAGNPYTSQESAVLIDRTTEIVEHCKGSIHEWTINELFNDDGTPKDAYTLVNARTAIETVREADPTAKIIINDFGMEWTPNKDRAYFNFVSTLMADGTLKPEDMIGHQGHNGINYGISAEQFAQWFDKYAKLGLNLRLTEVDVFDVTSLNNSYETKKAEIIMRYYNAGEILKQEYQRKVLDAIIVWGSTNNSSWLNDIGKTGEYPLLLNNNGSPYLSWYVLAKELFKLDSTR